MITTRTSPLRRADCGGRCDGENLPGIGAGRQPREERRRRHPAEARAIARKAYIWGYALVDDHRIQYTYFIDKNHPECKGDWNTIGHTSLHAGRHHDPDDQHRHPLFVQDLQPEDYPKGNDV